MPDPTVKFIDKRDYSYVETSPWWKEQCSALPSFSEVWWPDYDTKVIEDVIDGQAVVIQLWKGWCQKFLGDEDFPGGIGAEVGVYRRMPGRVPPEKLPLFPPHLSTFILGGLSKLGGNHIWWAYPELETTLEFDLVNPKTKEVFFSAGPEKTYWMNRWMNPESYERYRADLKGKLPIFSADYSLEYRINGKAYQW